MQDSGYFHNDLEKKLKRQAKYVQPIVMAALMASMMTGFVTWLNLGLPSDFFWRWARAFLVAWPMASMAAFVAIPAAQRITQSILRVLNGAE